MKKNFFATMFMIFAMIGINQSNASTVTNLENKITEGVRGCRGGEGSNVPIITWGADAVTLFANGGSLNTEKNSFFDKNGLKIKLKREDVFENQVKSYMRCETPWLRLTVGQMNLVDFLNKDERTKMKTVLQLSWSNGGDAIVVKEGISSVKDLKGKTIALMNNGPHIDYLTGMLSDAGLTFNDVKLIFTKDLTGDSDDTPAIKFLEEEADAAMVISTDAFVLTSNNKVGTGAEGSRKGSKIMLSTRSGSRVISDIYVVRNDYLENNRVEVEKFVKAWLDAEDVFVKNWKNDKNIIKSTAKHLLGAESAISDAEGLISEAETSGYTMNIKFFNNEKWSRNFKNLNKEVSNNYNKFDIAKSNGSFDFEKWNYDQMKSGITTMTVDKERYSAQEYSKISQSVTNKAANDSLDESALFSFKINFEPNKAEINSVLFSNEFKRVLELMNKYAGAVVTVEGHADPLEYLKAKKNNQPANILSRIRQSAKSTSLARSNSVIQEIIKYAEENGHVLDKSQFISIGYGFEKPLTGKNDVTGEPLNIKSKEDWLSNMRVEFKLINIESEASEFELL